MTRVSKLFAFLVAAAAVFGLSAGALAAGGGDGAAAGEPGITFSKPAEKHPGCFAESVRLPRGLLDRLPQRVEVQFTVREDGAIDAVLADGASPALATQLRGALARCAWTPAADEKGVPMSVAVRLPVRFDLDASAPGAAQQAIARVERPTFTPVALAQR
jgi:hypothetical protein